MSVLSRVFGLVEEGLEGLLDMLTPCSTPPPTHSLWGPLWLLWLGVVLLGLTAARLVHNRKRLLRCMSRKCRTEARKDDTESWRAGLTPSSEHLTSSDIASAVSFFTDSINAHGIPTIDHSVMDYTYCLLGTGRYSKVYAIRSDWSQHREAAPLCVKCLISASNTSILSACIEALNVAALSDVPGVPRVVAVCLRRPPLIVMTRHSAITMDVLLRDYSSILPDMLHLYICHQLCVTLDSIHQLNRVHNDVKGNNICVDIVNKTRPIVTLIDYGHMTMVGEAIFHEPTSEAELEQMKVEHAQRYPWYDLSLYLGGPASPNTDVYSVAVLFLDVLRAMKIPPLPVVACVREGLAAPAERPPLSRFKEVLREAMATSHYKLC